MISSIAFGQDGEGDGTGDPTDPTGGLTVNPCVGTDGNATLFKESVGVNFLFSDPPGPVEGIATKFRQFTLWHNTGWDNSNLVNSYNETFPFSSNHKEFYPFEYNFESFYSEGSIGKKLENMLNNEEIDALFPAISVSIENLSTNWAYEGNWILKDNAHRDAIWRKPIPYTGNPLVSYNNNYCLGLSEDECPESYNFFAEFLTHYVGFYDLYSNTPSPNRYSKWVNVPNKHFNTHIELWNEPDAWWTKPNDYGYFTPTELAAMCTAAIGDVSMQTTIPVLDDQNNIEYKQLEVGISKYINKRLPEGKEKFKIISPSLHVMDVGYYNDFLNKLRVNIPEFKFDVVGLHHYSAYEVGDLRALGGSPSPDVIVAESISNSNGKTHPYNLTTGNIKTVNLESAPSSNTAYWISPESDGYFERGKEVRSHIPDGELWWTEWGYSSIDGGQNGNIETPKYPKSLGPGFSPDEIQARWLLRGFMEIDKSAFTASMWHWYKEQNGNEWDTHTGLLDAYGQKKTAWYYLHTIMNEIGDRYYATEQVLFIEDPDNPDSVIPCETGYVPDLLIDSPRTGDLEGENPHFSCPKIYWYADQLEEGETLKYTDFVTAVWFPYMVNYIDEVEIPLDAVITCDFPTHYFIVTPVDGEANGVAGKIHEVLWGNSPVNTIDPYIKIPASEKPIFIHYLDDDNGGTTDRTTCKFEFSEDCEDNNSCTSVTIKLEIFPLNNCEITIDELTVTSASDNVPLPIHLTDLNLNTGDTLPTFTITGLQPCTSYSFDFAINYTATDNGTGLYISTVSCTTACENEDGEDCISSDISFGNPTTTFSCYEPMMTVCVPIIFDGFTAEDLNSFTLAVSSEEVTSGGAGGISSSIPMDNYNPSDWDFNDSGAEMCIEIENIALATFYNITFQLVDNSGNVWLESSSIVTTPSVINDSYGNPCSGPGGVTGITVTISKDCENKVCFTPVGEITEYKLFVRDQDGTTLEFFVDFNNSTLNEDGQYCFTGIDLSPLQNSPLVGFIKTISSGGNTNSSSFDLEECPCKSELNVYNTCVNNEVEVVVQLCFDVEPNCFNLAENIDFESNSDNMWSIWMECNPPLFYPNVVSECCFYFYTRFDEDDCENVEFTITFDEFSWTGVLNRSLCCDENGEITGAPITVEYDRLSTSSEGVSISAKVPTVLSSIINESRANNIPVKYVLYNKIDNQFEKVKAYNSKMFFDLPYKDIDIESIQEEYEIYFLVNNEIYGMTFPDLNSGRDIPIEGRQAKGNSINPHEELSLFPNPAKNEVTILLKNGDITAYKMYNILGEQVLGNDWNNRKINLDISKIKNGVYFIEVQTSEHKYLQKKLIIQKK